MANFFQGLIFQLPVLATGVVLGIIGDKLFTKRAEDRAEKRKLLSKIDEIFTNAEEQGWTEYGVNEVRFINLLRRLARYNISLSDELVNNYPILWGGVSSISSLDYKKISKEDRLLAKDSISELKNYNRMFQNYAFPEKRVKRYLRKQMVRNYYKTKRLIRTIS